MLTPKVNVLEIKGLRCRNFEADIVLRRSRGRTYEDDALLREIVAYLPRRLSIAGSRLRTIRAAFFGHKASVRRARPRRSMAHMPTISKEALNKWRIARALILATKLPSFLLFSKGTCAFPLAKAVLFNI